MKSCHRRHDCGQQGPAGVEIPRLRALATMERLPPPKPRETKVHCVKPLGQRLMPRDFDGQAAEFQLCGRPERLRRAWRPRRKSRRIGLSRERGSPTVSRFVQQSRPGCPILHQRQAKRRRSHRRCTVMNRDSGTLTEDALGVADQVFQRLHPKKGGGQEFAIGGLGLGVIASRPS